MSKSKVKKGIYWRGGVLWIRYAGPGGKIFKKSAHTTSVRKAEKLLNSKKGQVADEKHPTGPEYGPLFRGFATKWLEGRKRRLKLSSFRDYQSIFEKYLLPTFGDKRLGRITVDDIEDFVLELTNDDLSNKRANNILTPLKTLLKHAYRKRCMSTNLVEFIEMLPVDKPLKSPLSIEDVNAFLTHVDPHFKDYFQVAFFTGLRPSEQIALKHDNIDFARGKITVEDARVLGVESAPKTRESRRTIDMIPPTKESLERQAKKTFLKSPYVFLSKKGTIVSIDNLRKRVWYPALEAAGLRRRVMYQTRHTFATLMLSTGENAPWIAAMMGHTSTEMLHKRYSDYIPNLTHQDGSAFLAAYTRTGELTQELTHHQKNKDSGLP